MSHYIELLSPAKNLECGIEAVNHGADAVYIGPARYGARVDAGNSISDLAQLVKYAHLYGSKIFVTINTILTDKELEEVEHLIHDLYNIGVDALIVQDMGILKLSLPPIALHASTQTDNRTPEKVRFLHEVGFQRVVLARELSLSEMKAIHEATPVELEAFVHGALCVSYSGQCYMSQAAVGRSANRGCCAQYCRLPYSLLDADGRQLVEGKHLLSLKDMDRSHALKEMIDAGITSFKIEGRLKDVEYVKNITAYYRQRLDAILEERPELDRPSWGKSIFFFQPNPQKTFHRGRTEYFLHGERGDMACFDTPKSVGEPIGKVSSVKVGSLSIDTRKELHNGDGFCFVTEAGVMTGFRINSVEGNRLIPSQMPDDIRVGDLVYRNYDHQFAKELAGKSAERKMAVSLKIREMAGGLNLTMSAENGIEVTETLLCEKQLANKPEQAVATMKAQLGKLGGSPFELQEVEFQWEKPWFVPNSLVNDLRRRVVENMIARLSVLRLSPDVSMPSLSMARYPESSLTYLGNVMNTKAQAFYREHGVECLLPAFETKTLPNAVVMFCKHCIRYSLGWCKKNPSAEAPSMKEPLYLQYKDKKFQLEFDCVKCEMRIRHRG